MFIKKPGRENVMQFLIKYGWYALLIVLYISALRTYFDKKHYKHSLINIIHKKEGGILCLN